MTQQCQNQLMLEFPRKTAGTVQEVPRVSQERGLCERSAGVTCDSIQMAVIAV